MLTTVPCPRYTCVSSLSLIFSIFVPFGTDTGISLDQLNQGTGYIFMMTGISPLILNPLAEVIGKRPIYLGTILVQAGCYAWAANLNGPGQWVGNCIIRGACLGPAFSLCEISVADVASCSLFSLAASSSLETDVLHGIDSFSNTNEPYPCHYSSWVNSQAH